MKSVFEVVDANQERIFLLADDAYDFCVLWKSYLASCGWTEQEYEDEAERRIFRTCN